MRLGRVLSLIVLTLDLYAHKSVKAMPTMPAFTLVLGDIGGRAGPLQPENVHKVTSTFAELQEL